jgi:hypothetical protein
MSDTVNERHNISVTVTINDVPYQSGTSFPRAVLNQRVLQHELDVLLINVSNEIKKDFPE